MRRRVHRCSQFVCSCHPQNILFLTFLQIAAVFCICGALAREAAEAADGEPALELVASPAAAIADLLHEEPGSWVAAHGGWVRSSSLLMDNETFYLQVNKWSWNKDS